MTELNRDEKATVVAEVVERLGRTEAVVTADFRGLTVAELAELRTKLREVDAEMTVVKNTLSRRAADETGRTALLPYLQGPTGLVWVNGDAAQAAKALNDFAKAHQEVFTIRGGVLGAEDLPASSVIKLASLPSREQMLAQLAGGLAAPISGLAGRLNGLIGKMARALAAVAESGALAPGEAPAVPAPADEAPAEAPATADGTSTPDAEVTSDGDTVAVEDVEAPAESDDVASATDASSEAEVATDAQVEPVTDDVPAAEAPAEGDSATPESDQPNDEE